MTAHHRSPRFNQPENNENVKSVVVEKIDSEDPKAFKMDFIDNKGKKKDYKEFQLHQNQDKKVPQDFQTYQQPNE